MMVAACAREAASAIATGESETLARADGTAWQRQLQTNFAARSAERISREGRSLRAVLGVHGQTSSAIGARCTRAHAANRESDADKSDANRTHDKSGTATSAQQKSDQGGLKRACAPSDSAHLMSSGHSTRSRRRRPSSLAILPMRLSRAASESQQRGCARGTWAERALKASGCRGAPACSGRLGHHAQLRLMQTPGRTWRHLEKSHLPCGHHMHPFFYPPPTPVASPCSHHPITLTHPFSTQSKYPFHTHPRPHTGHRVDPVNTCSNPCSHLTTLFTHQPWSKLAQWLPQPPVHTQPQLPVCIYPGPWSTPPKHLCSHSVHPCSHPCSHPPQPGSHL